MFSIVIENAKLKLALDISTGATITESNDAIEMLKLVADKTTKDLSKIGKRSNIFTKPFTR